MEKCTCINLDFKKENGFFERVSINAHSKREFREKLNSELMKRNIEYIDYTKWNPSNFDKNHKWFQ